MSQLTLTIKRDKDQTVSKLSFRVGESLLCLCQKEGIELAAPCGGKGICKKCRVRFLSGAPIPKPSERKALSAEELRQGYRLACMTTLSYDCEIILPKEKKADAVGTGICVSWEHTDFCYPDKEKNRKEKYFITADIGTTTVVMEKRSVRDGRVVSVYRDVNAQRKYGADVLSRMEASVNGKKEELSKLMKEQIQDGLHKFSSEKETDDALEEAFVFMIIAANTSMIHLLMGYDVGNLCKAPFKAKTLDEIETEICGVKTYIMPGISAFVGADLIAGMYAVLYLKKQIGIYPAIKEENERFNSDRNDVGLLIDLGTNAEMILFDEKRAVCTSAAAGCAFDSIADAGIYGADVIAILAELLKSGAIDEHGTLRDDLFESGISVTINPDENQVVNITQDQIRQMQLAKAAVRCGIDYLTEAFGCQIEDISHVYLAGGFGYYLDVDAAAAVGLLPEACRNITYSCGNTALAGAAVYASEKLRNPDHQHDETEYYVNTKSFTAINLAQQPDFSQRYISYLDFE